MSSRQGEQVVKLALLIIRAGEKDSLRWWDDESLTEAGLFALSRILPRSPKAAAVRLAYLAARERHRGMLAAADVRGATTLLDFVETTLSTPREGGVDLSAVRDEPIPTVDQLHGLLRDLAPEITAFEVPVASGGGLLDLSDLVGRAAPGPQARATLLAAGYLQGAVAKPVIPYLRAGLPGGP